MDIKSIVEKLIQKHKTNDPFILCDCLNIGVIFADLDNVRGFYQCFKRKRLIYINNSLYRHEKRLVCGHELGHAILHHCHNKIFLEGNTHYRTSKYENEADLFCSYLMLYDIDTKGLCLNEVSSISGVPGSYLKLIYK
jgi:Zn-dependent peptidase ImmA (M78 family)